MAEKARHAFGMLENIDSAISAGTIDAYDILFVKDASGKPYVGWIDKLGNKVILEDKVQVVRVDELPTSDGDENVIYVHNNEGYIWDGSQCVPMSKSADLTALETQVSDLEVQMSNKIDAGSVQTMIDAAVGSGNTASANAIAQAKQEAIDTAKAYIDNQIAVALTVTEF